MNVKIRKGTIEDLEWMIPELREFAKFARHKHSLFPEDDEYIKKGFENLILNHLVLVADKLYVDDSTEGIGFIVGMFSPHAFNPKVRTLIEMFWWVKESERRGSAGLRLLDEFDKIGQEQADWIIFTLETFSPVNEKTLFKRGFERKEINYLKEI